MSSTTDATSGVSTWAKDSVQPVQEAPSIQMTGYRLPDVAPISLRHARNRELGEPGCGGDAGAQLHEAATGNATRGKDAVKV